MEPSFSPIGNSSQKRWYKTKGGILFIILATTIGIAGSIFAGFVIFYTVKISTGQGAELANQFQGFSRAAGVAEVKAVTATDVLKTISAKNPTLGPENAPVTVLAFMDFECPFSKQAAPMLEELNKKYGSSVKIIFKHFPIVSIHQFAADVSVGASCAQDQQKFWEYYATAFYQDELTKDTTNQTAAALGLNQQLFASCVSAQKNVPHIEQDLKDGVALGVRGTPTFFINEKRIEGVPSAELWDQFIQAALK